MTESAPSAQDLLLAGYILGDLDPAESTALETLLTTQPHLRQDLAQLQAALEQPYVTAVTPPPHLRAAILSAHEAITQTIAAQAPPVRPTVLGHAARRWGWSLGAIAATVILGLSLSNYWLWQSWQASQRETPTDELWLVALEPADASTPGNLTGTVQVAIDPQNLEANLNVSGLPPLAPGQVYVLWTVVVADAPVTTDAKGAILTEVFTVDPQGQLSRQIAIPPVFRDRELVKAVAITVEDAAAPQRHASAPIFIEQL